MNPWLNITCIMVVLYHFGVGTVSGTALTVGERIYVCSAISDLYMDLIGKLGLDTREVDGLLGWLISYEKKKNVVYELDEYVQWARDGAIMLLNSANNLSHQREEFDDLFQKTKGKILEKMLEWGKPGAAASINNVLDSLNFALVKYISMEDAESAGTKLDKNETTYVYWVILDLYGEIKNNLVPQVYKIEGLDDWIHSDKANTKQMHKLDEYVKWVRDGAIMLVSANSSHQGGKFDDLFKEAKDKILAMMPENSKPGAAASINKVLDNLKTALNENRTIEYVETASK